MAKTNSPTPSQALIRKLFGYDEQGLYRLRDSTNAKAGKRAHKVHSKGYVGFKVAGKTYGEHRLVWLYHFGYMPKLVDHINGNRSDNRIENLREASPSENISNSKLASNNTSGAKGVIWAEDRKKWRARITSNGVRSWLGSFDSFDEALKGANTARIFAHKQFANTGVVNV